MTGILGQHDLHHPAAHDGLNGPGGLDQGLVAAAVVPGRLHLLGELPVLRPALHGQAHLGQLGQVEELVVGGGSLGLGDRLVLSPGRRWGLDGIARAWSGGLDQWLFIFLFGVLRFLFNLDEKLEVVVIVAGDLSFLRLFVLK